MTEARPTCMPAPGGGPQGERKEATLKILREFMHRAWLESCHSEGASPYKGVL